MESFFCKCIYCPRKSFCSNNAYSVLIFRLFREEQAPSLPIYDEATTSFARSANIISRRRHICSLCKQENPAQSCAREYRTLCSGRCSIAVFTAPSVRALLPRQVNWGEVGRSANQRQSYLRAPLIKCRFNQPSITVCAGYF